MCEVTWIWRFSQTQSLASRTGGYQSRQLAKNVSTLRPSRCSFLDFSALHLLIFPLLSAYITAQHSIFQTQAREHTARTSRGNCLGNTGLEGLEFRVKAPLLSFTDRRYQARGSCLLCTGWREVLFNVTTCENEGCLRNQTSCCANSSILFNCTSICIAYHTIFLKGASFPEMHNKLAVPKYQRMTRRIM